MNITIKVRPMQQIVREREAQVERVVYLPKEQRVEIWAGGLPIKVSLEDGDPLAQTIADAIVAFAEQA